MEDVTYTISQAAKLLGVETYVLRFWEEELLLEIGRNAKGYRAYTKDNIEMLQRIKELRKTHPLKEIRNILLDKDQKQEQFFEILERLVTKTLEERKSPESRYKRLDQAIRFRQMARKQVAAAEIQKQK